MTWPDCQNAEMRKCKDVKIAKIVNAKMPNCENVINRNCENCQNGEMRKNECVIIREHQNARIPNCENAKTENWKCQYENTKIEK